MCKICMSVRPVTLKGMYKEIRWGPCYLGGGGSQRSLSGCVGFFFKKALRCHVQSPENHTQLSRVEILEENYISSSVFVTLCASYNHDVS